MGYARVFLDKESSLHYFGCHFLWHVYDGDSIVFGVKLGMDYPAIVGCAHYVGAVGTLGTVGLVGGWGGGDGEFGLLVCGASGV